MRSRGATLRQEFASDLAPVPKSRLPFSWVMIGTPNELRYALAYA
jgi:hypothetical protein